MSVVPPEKECHCVISLCAKHHFVQIKRNCLSFISLQYKINTQRQSNHFQLQTWQVWNSLSASSFEPEGCLLSTVYRRRRRRLPWLDSKLNFYSSALCRFCLSRLTLPVDWRPGSGWSHCAALLPVCRRPSAAPEHPGNSGWERRFRGPGSRHFSISPKEWLR